ncbi:hypothetical protein MIND_00756600 [Mycena indigotica]|uniref:Uncharacterized protein n=1 Tax=Mycena indigotica TaxID=2126181 RepID=A0A8H6W3U1_9AGAR|nr:uncharacterized protein MIND_00756600 [Mycena indigotica]KAF7301906.1 hypothetical protein MIND_00756600 [Mycena indigotica]
MFYSHRRLSSASTTNTLKGKATCHSESLVVQITVKPASDSEAVAGGASGSSSVVFVSTHTIHNTQQLGRAVVSTGSESRVSSPPPPAEISVSTRGEEARDENQVESCESETFVATGVLEWCDINDVDTDVSVDPQISHPLHSTNSKCSQIMPSISSQPTQLLSRLLTEPGAVSLCESDAACVVLTPAEEDWADFTRRCSNQPNLQWTALLVVPPTNYAYSPYGPTSPVKANETRVDPMTVFSASRFAVFKAALALQTTEQAFFTQRHMFKAVAHDACIAGASVRAYYDHEQILDRLHRLSTYLWNDPADYLLETWRHCVSVTIHESDHPFTVPHIVVSHSLPNAPWDCEAVLAANQDEDMLQVPLWEYHHPIVDAEDDEDDLERLADLNFTESESTSESDEARTPSPPNVYGHPRLETLLEEEEEAEEDQPHPILPVRQVRSRQPWLEDDDKDFVPPMPVTRFKACLRIELSCSLPTIDEDAEPTYQPLRTQVKSLWSSRSWSVAEYIEEMQVSLEEEEYTEEDEDDDTYGFGHGYRPQDVLRPSCDIFINEEDTPQQSPISPSSSSSELPRGKANVPTGTIDWFDLPEDDLGPIEWATG